MFKTYIIVDEHLQMYRSHWNPSLMIAEGYMVEYALTYTRAKKFHTLWYAKHRVNTLLRHTDSYFYVYQKIVEVDGIYLFELIDKSLSEKKKKCEQEYEEKILKIIQERKKRKNLM